VPDWLLAIPRFVWAPVSWARRRVQRRTLAQHALVREGSEVVTPAIEFTKNLGPASILFGTDEFIDAQLRKTLERWDELRPPLLV
jgi:hypothetical protein